MKKPELRIRLEPQIHEEEASSSGSGYSPDNDAYLNGHIYFYEQVGQASAMKLISQLHSLDNRLVQEATLRQGTFSPNIHLHLNSFGGDAFASFAIADRIRNLNAYTTCTIEGIASSGGTIIALACDYVQMTVNSMMMIHQHSSWFVGTYEQFKDDAKSQEILIDKLAAFYQSKSNLNDEAIRELLKHDYWMDAQEALEKGFIDKVV